MQVIPPLGPNIRKHITCFGLFGAAAKVTTSLHVALLGTGSIDELAAHVQTTVFPLSYGQP